MAKILIAEDDITAQKVISKLVENLGHTVFVSPNGKHAYESLLASNGFDTLITDIMMPEMDGRDLVKTVRGNTIYKDLPIIVISAVIGISDISDLLELGATYFLPKPVNKADLEEYLDLCIKK